MSKEGGSMQQLDQFFPKNSQEILNNNIANKDVQAIHEKIEKYSQLQRTQRAGLVRSLPVVIEQLGVQGVKLLKPLFDEIIKDKDEIVRSLIEKLGEAARQLEKLPEFQENIKRLLIPTINFYLNYPMLEVKELAGKEMGELAHKLNDQDRRDFVLKHVIEMAHDDENEDNRIVAVQLFGSLADCFGQSLCEQFIGFELLSLGEDMNYKVRKETILQLPVVARLVNKQFFGRLFQFFRDKASDKSNWVIRKASIDVLGRMGQLCSKQQRENELTKVMLNLLRDQHKTVKLAAYKSLGTFIHELKGGKISQELITQFCRMVENDVVGLGKQNEVAYSCAYNFPAVLDAVGKEKWENQLYKVYEKLLKIKDKTIKITLSQSLHQIAKLLGQSLTEKYLFKIVDVFFKDKNDEIKLGVIKHIADIMTVMSESKRQALVGVFEQFQMDQKKWRIRQCIGHQLGQILQIYKPHIIFEYVIPILLKFCSDSVSTVRQGAARRVADFVEKLRVEEGLLLVLVESVKAFGTSPKYTQRQSFLMMCEGLMQHPQLFEKEFLSIMAALADDKVVNVKLVLAQIVKNHIDSKGTLSQNKTLLELRQKLSKDQNEQVRAIFQEA